MHGTHLAQVTKPNSPSTYSNPYARATHNNPTPAQTEPEPYPFYEIEPRFPSWNISKASLASGYMIMQKGKSDKDPFTDKTMPTLFFAANVFQEIQHIIKTMAPITGECGGFLLTRKINAQLPHFLAYDFFMPGQDASGAEVELDGAELNKYIDYFKEKYPGKFSDEIHNDLSHWHSHGNMGAFFSGTDDKQQFEQSQLGFQGDYRFYLTFNSKGDIKSGFVQYYPVHFRMEDIHLGIYFGEAQYTTTMSRQDKTELEDMAKDVVRKRSFGTSRYGGTTAPYPYQGRGGGYGSLYDDDWDGDCYGYPYAGSTVKPSSAKDKDKSKDNKPTETTPDVRPFADALEETVIVLADYLETYADPTEPVSVIKSDVKELEALLAKAFTPEAYEGFLSSVVSVAKKIKANNAFGYRKVAERLDMITTTSDILLQNQDINAEDMLKDPRISKMPYAVQLLSCSVADCFTDLEVPLDALIEPSLLLEALFGLPEAEARKLADELI